jgi:enoyl-[acyl-carrier protein] reductase/trans-2-enoyl-CoA reductase (NAD+)
MTEQLVEPRIRGFICLTAHPAGCAAEVVRQADLARASGRAAPAGQPRPGLLVVGASTGYGLASRVAGAFGYGMDSVGVSFERPSDGRRTASAGWYNLAAFEDLAGADGLHATDLIGDAFSHEVREATLDHVRATLQGVDRFVYSIAAPRCVDPDTGEVFESVLKTVGEPVEIKTIDLRTEQVTTALIEAATQEEIDATVRVMGGADMARWVRALLERGLLRTGAQVVAFSYIGPEVTWPIYKLGTIGHAKMHLESTCRELDALLAAEIGGGCHVSINKSVVTQASSAIPGVPLYMSLLFGVMKEHGWHEGTIEQMARLYADHFAPGAVVRPDAEGRIRLDDMEMRADVQQETMRRWAMVDSANLAGVADWAGFQADFRRLFGFGLDSVDYSRAVEVEVTLSGVVPGFGAR